MRILYLNAVANLGGAERMLLTAIAGIKRVRAEIDIHLILGADGPLARCASELGASVNIVEMPTALRTMGESGTTLGTAIAGGILRAPMIARYLYRLRKAIVQISPDLIHSNGIKSHLLVRLAAAKKIPVFWHIHDFIGRRPLTTRLLSLAQTRTCAAIAVSQAVAEDLHQVLPALPVSLVRNAVDTKHFTPGPPGECDLDLLAGRPPAPNGTIRFGLVATFARWKGHLTFLDAAAKLLRETPHVPIRCYIVGGPIYDTSAQFSEKELQNAIKSRALSAHVGIIPFVTDTVPIYRTLDVIIHASTLPEPFGLVVAEGMACGRAVIVSKTGATPELFTDEVDALGIAPGNVDQLAGTMHRLATNPELRTRLAGAARCAAERHLDAESYGDRLLQAYRTATCRN